MKDLKGFINYKKVKVLRTEYNNLEVLNGIQNMSELEFLNSQNNKLGINENKDLKNSENDSLSFLVNCKNLKNLNLTNNNIIFIEYIKDLPLQYLYLQGNPNFSISSVSQIASLYTRISGTNKSIDSNYGDYLTTSENLKYKGLENITPEGKENYKYLVNLESSKKLLVKYLDLSGSLLTNSEFNELLSGYNGLIELNCTGCRNLQTLNWMEGKTNLRQFLFEDTDIVGTEVSRLDLYATSLQSFKCNNVNIDLTSMQETISRARCYNGVAGYTGYCGAGITNKTLAEQLEDCTEITYLTTNGLVHDDLLDLTNCTKLTNMYIQGGGSIILPSSLTGLDACFCGQLLDLRNFENKSMDFRVTLGHSGQAQSMSDAATVWLINQLEQFVDYNVSVRSIWFDIRAGNYLDYDLLSYLNKICVDEINFSGLSNQENFKFVKESWTGTLCNLKSLFITGTTLGDLSFLQNNTNLENLSLSSCKIKDISGLKCYSSLKNLDLSNNQITNLENLSQFIELGGWYQHFNKYGGLASDQGILNLSNNPIEEVYKHKTTDGKPIFEEDGQTQKKTENLKELAKLKTTAPNLKTIILLPNELIKDYSPLTSVGWDKETGNFK